MVNFTRHRWLWRVFVPKKFPHLRDDKPRILLAHLRHNQRRFGARVQHGSHIVKKVVVHFLANLFIFPMGLSTAPRISMLTSSKSPLAFPNELNWVDFRLVRFDRKSGESIGQHLFFLPRVETGTWNLRRVRGQLLDTISRHGIGAIGTRFRLSLWPRMEPVPHSSHLSLPLLAVIPTTASLDPRVLCTTYWVTTSEIGL